MMGYLNRDAVHAHEQRVRAEASATIRRQRLGVRYRIARFLVLTGAKLIPERPAVIGDSVIVFTPSGPEPQRDRDLRPAA
jgi:hypothetical protein